MRATERSRPHNINYTGAPSLFFFGISFAFLMIVKENAREEKAKNNYNDNMRLLVAACCAAAWRVKIALFPL
jgi:hypothetical protein